MKKVFFSVSWIAALWSCNDVQRPAKDQLPVDSVAVARGRNVFTDNCSGCHNFRHDGIGPQLGGVTDSLTDAWIAGFIRNPKAKIDSGDPHARKLFDNYHAVMPSFAALSDTQVNDLVAFLHTKKKAEGLVTARNWTEVTDPVPDTIRMSEVTVALQPFAHLPASAEAKPFTRINKMAFLPGKTFVLDMRGKIYALKDKRPAVYLDVAALEPHFLGQPGLGTGLGSVAFHPDFTHNGLLYTTHTEPARTRKADFAINDSVKTELQWVVTEWKSSLPAANRFTGTHRELLRVDMVTGMHGLQEITFNPKAKSGDADYGCLYIGVGDGGCAENGYPSFAHDPSKVWGTVLRIDPSKGNSSNGRYGIPASNPFANDPAKLNEVYAYGFRNPNRISWSRSGLMLVSNIGQANVESVNIVGSGQDFGWPLREGPFVMDVEGDMKKIYKLPADDSVNRFVYPALQYDHREGNAVSGGFEYTGTKVPALVGKYVFGDVVSGRVFFAEVKDMHPGRPAPIKELRLLQANKPVTLKALTGDPRVDLRFAQDQQGEMYILTKSDGMIYRLLNKN